MNMLDAVGALCKAASHDDGDWSPVTHTKPACKCSMNVMLPLLFALMTAVVRFVIAYMSLVTPKFVQQPHVWHGIAQFPGEALR